jgi:hypothetical protein
MAFFKGSATDYHDMLDVLKNLVKSGDDHISAATIYDGGTGYAVNDTITLAAGTKYHEPEFEVLSIGSGSYATGATVAAGGTTYSVGDLLFLVGGTYTVQCICEVTSVSGGVVTGVQVNNPGIYSATPGNPVSTTTDGSGSGCTLTMTWTSGSGIITGIHIADSGVYTTQASNPVSQNTSSGSGTGAKFTVTYTDTAWESKVDYTAKEATATAISAAGTGYTLNDIVTVVGGTFTVNTTVKVTAVSGGVPTAVAVEAAGEYSTTPSNPASTSGGTGSGLTLTMTWTDTTVEHKYLMIHNTNSDQYIGWKAFYNSTETAYLLQCTGFTGFTSLSTPWDTQPGSTAADGSEDTYVPLSGGGTPATVYYWMAVDDDRIVCAFKVASVYPNMYLGGLDRFLTSSEWAYPQVIIGCIAREKAYTYGGADFAGMNNGIRWAESSFYEGPGILRDPAGQFRFVYNSYVSSNKPFYSQNSGVKCAPTGGTFFDLPVTPNNWYDRTQMYWHHMFTEDDVVASGQDVLGRISSKYVLIPCTLAEENVRIYGNLKGVFGFNPDGGANAEDRIFIGTKVYRCFQNCAYSNRNYFFAIEEK